jgi:hypothetical protein
MIEGMLWFAGDFNGDGKEDLATVWNDAGMTSMDVYVSTGTAFIKQRWATRQGDVIAGMLWFVGDFDGDSQDDLAVTWNNAGMISVDVYVSTGTAFSKQRWATQQGAVMDGMLWFTGDFDGDGREDLAVTWSDAGMTTMDVYGSTGTGFTKQRWATRQGNVIGGMLWFVGDFSGDGKEDLAVTWNDSGMTTMDVYGSTGTGFTKQRWATRQGDVIAGMLWFVGDFNGDGRDDLAVRWDNAGMNNIDVYASTGAAFTIQRWVTRQGTVIDGMHWFPGDFSGDGKDDLAVSWNDAGKITIDVFLAQATSANTPTHTPVNTATTTPAATWTRTPTHTPTTTPTPTLINTATATPSATSLATPTTTPTCAALGIPGNPSPANGATGVASNVDLDWVDTAGATAYSVHFGTSPSPPYHGDSLTSSYALPVLSCGTHYYWSVVASDACASIPGPLWEFTTLPCKRIYLPVILRQK